MEIKPLLKPKKSQGFVEFFLVIVFLLAISLFLVVLNKAWGETKPILDEGLSSALPSDSSVNASYILTQTSSSILTFDKLLPFIIIGLFAFVLIAAGTYMQHPIMIFVGIIVLGVVVVLAVIFSNIYDDITSTDEFAAQKAEMPIQDKFMQYLPLIIFIMAIGITAAIIWSRKSGGGGL